MRPPSNDDRRNFVFGPLTLMTGCMPIVFTTTPPQPASNARMMFESDSVGGADARRKGFSKGMPVKRVDKVAAIGAPGLCAHHRSNPESLIAHPRSLIHNPASRIPIPHPDPQNPPIPSRSGFRSAMGIRDRDWDSRFAM